MLPFRTTTANYVMVNLRDKYNNDNDNDINTDKSVDKCVKPAQNNDLSS